MPLVYLERPADDQPEGLLVLHHGRGTEERDLLGLADALDPERRLQVVTPRAPLTLAGSPGYHWYLVPRVGYPDPQTFHAARAALAELHDELWEKTGIEPARTVLGGFSMGAVMSYAMAFSADRPAVAGVLAFGGFVPKVEGWSRRVRGSSGHAAPLSPTAGAIRSSRSALPPCSGAADGRGIAVDYYESDLATRSIPGTWPPRVAGCGLTPRSGRGLCPGDVESPPCSTSALGSKR